MQLFDEVYNLTEGKGGPSNATLTLSLYIYNLTFRFMPESRLCGDGLLCHRLLVALLAFVQFFAARERDR